MLNSLFTDTASKQLLRINNHWRIALGKKNIKKKGKKRKKNRSIEDQVATNHLSMRSQIFAGYKWKHGTY